MHTATQPPLPPPPRWTDDEERVICRWLAYQAARREALDQWELFRGATPDLWHRLTTHRLRVSSGAAADLRDSVRQQAERERQERAARSTVLAEQWEARQRGKAAKRWKHARAYVFRTKGRICTYCGDPATTVDHVIPKARGGTDAIHNLAPACAPCNSSKGKRTLEEWGRWRAARAAEHAAELARLQRVSA